jgi:hypothetical protein
MLESIVSNLTFVVPYIVVSTKAVPQGIRNVNKMVPSVEPYQESKAIESAIAAKANKQAEQEDGNDAEEEEDQVHDLKSNRSQATGSLLGRQDVNEHGSGHLHSNRSNNSVGKRHSSTFRVLWRGLKQSLGYGSGSAKTSRVVVMTIVLAVLGPTLARLRRKRR